MKLAYLDSDNESRKLEQFRGHALDFRLREFRKVSHKRKRIEFIRFDSKKGKKLLFEYNQQNNYHLILDLKNFSTSLSTK